MDLVRYELVLILAGLAAVAYLWGLLSARNKHPPISQPQSTVVQKEQSANNLPEEGKQVCGFRN